MYAASEKEVVRNGQIGSKGQREITVEKGLNLGLNCL